MTSKITIQSNIGHWVVRAQGAVIGESANALKLHEGDLDPVIYFPPDDVGTIFLERSDTVTDCPHKGRATHWHIEGKSSRIENAAWSYEDPLDDVARIKGHIAFYPDRVTLEDL